MVGARPPYPTLAERPDVLVFQTPVLAEDVEVTGHVVAELWVASSAIDTDFTAKLVDVYPGNRRLSVWLPHEHRGLHHPRPLPRRLRVRAFPDAR